MCLVAFSEKPLSDRRPDSNHACRWSFSRPWWSFFPLNWDRRSPLKWRRRFSN
jgi:hypothetical protein